MNLCLSAHILWSLEHLLWLWGTLVTELMSPQLRTWRWQTFKMLKVKVTSDVQNFIECLSGQYILWTVEPFVTNRGSWHSDVSSWARVPGHGQGQSVTVKVRGLCIIKIWPFLLYLQNCWPICSQTLTAYHHKSCEQTGSLCSRSRSQWCFKNLLNICQSCVFYTTDIFATRLGVSVYYQK